MRQIDYLKLVRTARRSSYMARPSEEDDALRNLILIAGTASLGLTFALAVAVSLAGTELLIDDIARALGWTFLPGVYLSVLSMFLGGARRVVLYSMAVPMLASSITLAALMLQGIDGHWLIYLPPLGFLTTICLVTFKQASLLR